MGYRTVIILSNDRLTEWTNDPKLGSRIDRAASVIQTDRAGEADSILPYGTVAEICHCDSQSLMVIDSLKGERVAQTFWNRRDDEGDAERRLLKQLAEKHGFDLHKKRAKKA